MISRLDSMLFSCQQSNYGLVPIKTLRKLAAIFKKCLFEYVLDVQKSSYDVIKVPTTFAVHEIDDGNLQQSTILSHEKPFSE